MDGSSPTLDKVGLKLVCSLCVCWGGGLQHDILWEALTARQHLRFYARIKNTPRDKTDAAIMRCLRQVPPSRAARQECVDVSPVHLALPFHGRAVTWPARHSAGDTAAVWRGG